MQRTDLTDKQTRVRIVPLKIMFEGIIKFCMIFFKYYQHFYCINFFYLAFCQLHPTADIMEVYLLAFSQLNKWFVTAKIIDMSRVTTTDAFLCFFQFQKSAIDYDEFLVFLGDLCEIKNLDLDEIKYKLQTCTKPTSSQSIGPRK